MHEIGNSLWMVPTVILGNALIPLVPGAAHLDSHDRLTQFLVTLNAAAYASAACALCYHVATRGYGVPRGAAFGGVLVFAFASQLLPYSRMLFDGLAAGLLLAV